MVRDAAAPYLRRDVREALGGTLRPGGFALTERALELRPFRPGARVLDVGCGLGSSVRRLRERYGLHAFGLDASMELLGESPGPFPLLCADATVIPVRSESLDGVFLECVLSLCPDPRAVLAEAARVLRSGGALVISDLYRRRDEGTEASDATGCLRGALPRKALFDLVTEAGLSLATWEDHSRLLADCAARLAFAGVPASAFFGQCGKAYCAFDARDFGYSLCIAENNRPGSDRYVENV